MWVINYVSVSTQALQLFPSTWGAVQSLLSDYIYRYYLIYPGSEHPNLESFKNRHLQWLGMLIYQRATSKTFFPNADGYGRIGAQNVSNVVAWGE